MAIASNEIVDGIEIDYSDLESKYKVQLQETLDTVLVIDRLPQVDGAKEEKLMTVLRKNIFAPAKATPLPESTWMPRDAETGLSKGHLFVEFATEEEASAVLQVAHGYRLDKAHVLSAVRLSDFERILSMKEEYSEPEIEPYEEKEYLNSWLADSRSRDQFVTLAGTTASVFWTARGNSLPELVHSRQNWTDSSIYWSPRGSYLATLHGPGVMLWGGASFGRLGKFPHQNVKLIAFSNNDHLLVSWSPPDPNRPQEHNLLVWDVLAGKLLRGWVAKGGAETDPNNWPMVKFSFDDAYAARIQDGALYIYELSSFTPLDKKGLKIDGLKDFSWSPIDHKLSHWTTGTEDVPSRITLLNVPSLNILRTKNLFNVNSCKVHWQNRGDYLAVQVERHSKNKKNIFSNLELFRLREKDIPVECLEFKDPLSAFSWEPEGDRFLTASLVEGKTNIAFYTMKAHEAGISTVKLLHSLERKTLSHFLWSPHGEFVLFVSTDSTSATLEFWNANDMCSLATREHYLASDVSWDPSGRYVASWVSARKQSSDHGFVIWDVRGERLCRINAARLSHLAWRPRPPSLLSLEQRERTHQNLDSYAATFEEADLSELSKESTNAAEHKSRLITLWNEWRRHCRREYEARTASRRSIVGKEQQAQLDTDGDSAMMEEWVEEIVGESEEILC